MVEKLIIRFKGNRYGEQLMVYFVFTYFCGAVYDGQAYGKLRLAVVSTLLIQEI